MIRLPKNILLASAITVAFSPTLLRADTWTWVPAAGGNWDTTTSNWNNGGGATTWNNAGTENAVIGGSSGWVVLQTAINASSVSLGNAKMLQLNGKTATFDTLTLNSGSQLYVDGTLLGANSGTSVVNLNTGSTIDWRWGTLGSATNRININLNGGTMPGTYGGTLYGQLTGSGDWTMTGGVNNAITINAGTTMNNTFTGNTNITNFSLSFTGYTSNTNFNPFGTDTTKTVTLTSSNATYKTQTVSFANTSSTNNFGIAQNVVLNTVGSGNQLVIQNSDANLRFANSVTVNTDSAANSGVWFATPYASKEIYIDGKLSGSGQISFSNNNGSFGRAALHLTNDTNDYNGTIHVTDRNYAGGAATFGILAIDASNAAQYATVDLTGTTNGGRLNLNAANITVAGLTSTGTPSGLASSVFTTSATTRSLTVNNAVNNTFNGLIGVSGSYAYDGSSVTSNAAKIALVKSGVGTLTLGGANAYVGGTTINAGTLATANTSALGTGAVTVAGGNLAVGSVGVAGIASLTVNTGGLDTTAGAITTTGAFALAGGTWKIGDAVNGVAAGSFAITGGVIDLTGFSNSAVNGTYNIIGGSGSASGYSFVGNNIAHDYAINTSGQLVITTAVPEPATYGLTGAGLLAGISFVKRRRRRA